MFRSRCCGRRTGGGSGSWSSAARAAAAESGPAMACGPCIPCMRKHSHSPIPSPCRLVLAPPFSGICSLQLHELTAKMLRLTLKGGASARVQGLVIGEWLCVVLRGMQGPHDMAGPDAATAAVAASAGGDYAEAPRHGR